MRRKAPALTALIAIAGASLFLLAPPASAQTGYPPGTCTVTTEQLGDLGDVAVGQTVSLTLGGTCVFEPEATVNVVFNGQPAGTKVANANGVLTVSVTVTSTTEVSINPVVRSQCGENTLSVTGPVDAGGTTVTKTGSVTIVCPAAAGPGAAGPGTAGAPPATAAKARVAFTGSNIFRWGSVAVLLLAVGGGFVMADRRRARKRA